METVKAFWEFGISLLLLTLKISLVVGVGFVLIEIIDLI